jgi:hypothetical protein
MSPIQLSLARCMFGLAFGVAMPLSSLAQTLPAAQYAGHYVVNADLGSPTLQITGPGLYSQNRIGQNGGGVASTSLNISATPAPTVSYTSTVSAPGVNPAAAVTAVQGDISFGPNNSLLVYSLEFLGPAGAVPIQVNALVQESASPLALGSIDYALQSSLTVSRGPSPAFEDFVDFSGRSGYEVNYAGLNTALSYDPTSGISGSVTDSHVWMAQTGVIYTVALNLVGGIGVSGVMGGGSMTETALIDPTFQISSQAINPSLYSVILSDGIGNSTVAAVPEPEISALMLVGLGCVGAVSVRRRRRFNA